MPADLAFELEYLLSEEAGLELRVLEARLEAGEQAPRLCVAVEAEGRRVEACTELPACRGLEGPRLHRCAAKTLAQGGRPLRQLAQRLREALKDTS